ncbi:MAG: bifunctional phosphoribosylaminoimidazolecarboxamide formyltransferase/inosine monophosphate cyclohydrolase [Zetaproteobacteria bacterium CG12_big_fil_rev_8_21_14_0_65_54_13]|nr:MAG: bifunctional phosphoribosylaminoimidazolecarboxamide formyltransferase/inosine monophosphate cyclohydrolase [Zetaproteobacteria bacterium CG12_big_fil_rev_8_21_14_0_65_54_13]PIX53439.1 MAG: bifunctional phosphoribosylaminoimidazolecarboxamide formyltransferase/inosine monophosphate cyclohydrolase [Zetaproteobacteria bacterium CG_4_10_14_3_um_filter_54_28]PJA29168.1 MAG: bifunctional phosphoribosylaminoimidazolecarboxamide formyltransferase/inosine monophosphate cyclohydrolase [Zetaproteob
MASIKRALISVSDKTGVADFARALLERGVDILSTGGTAKLLRDEGIACRDVSDYTGFPEMMDGRVKTLNPKVHGGILARRDNEGDLASMREHGIEQIDLVCVNLYPFREAVAKAGCTIDDAIENIDIGGPCMVRASAKNHRFVTIVVDPADYASVLASIDNGTLDESRRRALAVKAFAHTAAYDGAIANHFSALNGDGSKRAFPDIFTRQFIKTADELRYGENPHQAGAFYADPEDEGLSMADCPVLQGKAISYNNIADADAAFALVRDLNDEAVVIVKHANPCGVAMGCGSQAEIYERARAADAVSAFGGIAAFNRPLEADTAALIAETFMEVVIAPGFTDAARAVLAERKNLRLMLAPSAAPVAGGFEFKRVNGGLLVQQRDAHILSRDACTVVSKRAPTESEWSDMLFAWSVAKHVKSNAIVFAKNGTTLGVGAGQMNRVNSTRIAAHHGGESIKGSAVASDAFFPFRDGVDALAQAGATAVIQPGGSIRDDEVIAAADEQDIAMIFTGIRHFKH